MSNVSLIIIPRLSANARKLPAGLVVVITGGLVLIVPAINEDIT